MQMKKCRVMGRVCGGRSGYFIWDGQRALAEKMTLSEGLKEARAGTTWLSGGRTFLGCAKP